MTSEQDYRAIREGAALGEIALEGRLRSPVAIARPFLHGSLTNDIEALQPGTGCYAGWLTAQGRMITDMHVFESGDMMVVDVPAKQTAALLGRLDQFIFSETCRSRTSASSSPSSGFNGPQGGVGARAHAHRRVGSQRVAAIRNARLTFTDTPVAVARIDQLGVPGFTVYVARATEADVRSALRERRCARRWHRRARGRAHRSRVSGLRRRYGRRHHSARSRHRITTDLVYEGCYPGQEVIIRVLHRGGGRVVRKLVGLRVEARSPVPPRSPVHAGDKEIGFVTSGAVSPQSGSIALAYVHRDFVQPGSSVTTALGPATVTSLPFAAA
jgi:folate-binding Fe-S cluster repair protein YgfZ